MVFVQYACKVTLPVISVVVLLVILVPVPSTPVYHPPKVYPALVGVGNEISLYCFNVQLAVSVLAAEYFVLVKFEVI